MPRRRISYDIQVNTASAQREADRLANIFGSRLRNVQVGTTAGAGGAGRGGATTGGGRGGLTSGMPGSSLSNLVFGSAQFAFAGMFYKFFSELPSNIALLDQMATANRRAATSFTTLAGSTEEANAMIDAYIQGSGGAADRITATTQALRLFNIGMADNAREMRVFTTLTRGMSQALGRDSDYVQEQFALALANQSMLRFDQLGLSIEKHQELMTELEAKYPNLSREIIFQNAMIQQATERYYNLANAQEALATTTEIVSREMKNQTAIFAGWFSQNIAQPMAGSFAGLLGAEDYTLRVPMLQNQAERYRRLAKATEQGSPYAIPNNIERMFTAPFAGQSYASTKLEDIAQYEGAAQGLDALAKAMGALQAAENAGITVTEEWVNTVNTAFEAMKNGTTTGHSWRMVLMELISEIDTTIRSTDNLKDGMMEMGNAAEVAREQVEQVSDRLLGVATGLVGKLVEAGASPETIGTLLPSEDQLRSAAEDIKDAMAMQGDIIDDELALVMAEKALMGDAEAWIDSAEESERASKRAASELESAAQKAEKAFINAADSIVSAYDDMLQKIPGVFGTSEVTQEDLDLAKMGFPTNFADDALRRLEDVAFNQTKRGDVDLAAWAQALRMPEGTDPKALAIFARRAWESGELWANPENIQRFMNLDAAKGDLRGQELSALGQQNLRAFFGLGTDEGNEFLRVFGMEALDPIQDGLITEITTRGPIMGETLANMMHDGFNKRSLELPWVQSIMGAINSAIGRQLIGELNTNAASQMADAEALP